MASSDNNKRYWERNKAKIQKTRLERGTNFHSGVVVEIVHDPDERGGFSSGSQINCIPEMLRHLAFTPNTIIRNGGKTYRVNEHLGRQTLVWIDDVP